MIYLDNAATTNYKPQSVIDSVTDCITKYPFNPNRSANKHWNYSKNCTILEKNCHYCTTMTAKTMSLLRQGAQWRLTLQYWEMQKKDTL